MKLLIVVPSLNKGGVERVVSVLTQEWINKHEIKIAVFDEKNLDYSFGGDIINLKAPSLNGFFFKAFQLFLRFIQLLKIFRRENPDRIISFMEAANFPCIFAAYFSFKLKNLIVSVHADPSNMLKIQRFLIPYIYRLPKQVVSVSKGVANNLIKMGILKKNIKIIYNPLDSHSPSMSQILAKPKNAPKAYILAVGRLDKQKGFDLLIEAFSNIQNSNIHLVILGEGQEKKKLQNSILNKGLSDRVHLLGLVNDIWPWYRYAKCFVSSSLSESWGNVIVEAMSQGCPVVAFDCNYGPREIIMHKYNGLLIKPNDLPGLSNAINQILKQSYLHNKLSINGLTTSSKYDVKTLSSEWLT